LIWTLTRTLIMIQVLFSSDSSDSHGDDSDQ
jgi:hypothetical protein